MTSARRVLLLGSYAPSLIRFRGPLIKALVERGYEVVAAAPAIPADVSDELRKLGAEPRELSLVNASLDPFALLRSLREVRALIRDVRPGTVIAYTVKPVIVGALAGRAERVPRIVALITGAGYAFTGGRELKRRISRVAAAVLYRLALRRSSTVIFQNPDDQALFQRLGLAPRNGRTFVVNGSGIDLDHFSPRPLPEQPSFLMITRLLKDKGIREFAEAGKRLKREHPEVPIALVGYLDPSPDSLTKAELDELIVCGIDFKGELADVRPAIAECSVYVLPSYREGTPRSVLEAMAMGRAVVTTDAPGCRETVVDGLNGLLVAPRDAEALYQAMMRFVREPAVIPAMGAASRRIAEEKYDVERVTSEIIAYANL